MPSRPSLHTSKSVDVGRMLVPYPCLTLAGRSRNSNRSPDLVFGVLGSGRGRSRVRVRCRGRGRVTVRIESGIGIGIRSAPIFSATVLDRRIFRGEKYTNRIPAVFISSTS